MAVAGPFFDFCIRLSLPVKQNLEDSLADYGRHIADHLVFIPFHFFHLIRLSLKGGSLSYPATEAETILTKEEAKLLARAVRAVEVSTGYLRRLAESAGETGPMAPELILPLLFDTLPCPVNILDIKEAALYMDVGVFSEAAAVRPSAEVVDACVKYTDAVEASFYDHTYLRGVQERACIRALPIVETSKEVLLTLQRFRWLNELVSRQNFHLRITLGELFRTHSDSSYPTGGYSEITPERGDIERMLHTELIYMGEELGKADLFCMKYLENDLLYLKRDDSFFYGSTLVYIFDFSHVRMFIKDPGEMIPEYLYIILFTRSVITAIIRELPDIRTYFMVRNAPPPIREALGVFIPEGRLYDPTEVGRSRSFLTYVVYNGESSVDVKTHLDYRIDIDQDTFRMGPAEIDLFQKEDFRGVGRVSSEAFRRQFGAAVLRCLSMFFQAKPLEDLNPVKPADAHPVSKAVCPLCSSITPWPCRQCQGAGRDKTRDSCDWCKGSGKEPRACPVCDSAVPFTPSLITCEPCAGTGTVTCKDCEGGGRCAHCKGESGCPECHGKDPSCPDCHGSGLCSRCQDSGLCAICQGSKEVPCLLCGGKKLIDSRFLWWHTFNVDLAAKDVTALHQNHFRLFPMLPAAGRDTAFSYMNYFLERSGFPPPCLHELMTESRAYLSSTAGAASLRGGTKSS